MKILFLSMTALVVGCFGAQSDASPLPFPVKVGGQAATATPDQAFANIQKAVPNNAEIEVEAKGDLIIINLAPTDAKGEVAPGALIAVILLQATNKSALDKTMDGQKLKAGDYVMSVVAGEKTASIQLKIQ